MLKTLILIALTWMSMLLLPAQQSFAASGVGRVAYSYGPTWIERGSKLDKIHKGDIVFRNDSIITGSRGRVKVIMSDGSKVYVGAKSRISLRQYTMKKNKLFSATINMLWGKTRFFVNKLTSKTSSFKVNTPTAVLGVRGTEFVVSVPPTPELLNQSLQHITLQDMPALPTRTALIEGSIQVSTGIGKPVLLLPGHTADILANKTIKTFKTSNDDIDKHEQDVKPASTHQDKPEKSNTQQNEDELPVAPPIKPNAAKAPTHIQKEKGKPMKNNFTKPDPIDTHNAIQNLNSTTNITIKPSFVKP